MEFLDKIEDIIDEMRNAIREEEELPISKIVEVNKVCLMLFNPDHIDEDGSEHYEENCTQVSIDAGEGQKVEDSNELCCLSFDFNKDELINALENYKSKRVSLVLDIRRRD